MNEALKTAIEVMTSKLEQAMREVADLKRAINTMARAAGEAPPYEDAEPESAKAVAKGQTRPDRFYGKPPTTAARAYLEELNEPARAEDILKALEAGGFDFETQGWKGEKFRLKNLAISLSKNTAIFTRLPNGLFGLAKWYPGAKRPVKAAREGGEDEGEAEGAAEQGQAGQNGKDGPSPAGGPAE